jgi:Cu(I)/Ag(I) efflux system membrane fusion protein
MNSSGKPIIKYVWILTGFIILATVAVFLTSCIRKESSGLAKVSKTSTETEILYYTCGMHPSVRVPPENYNEEVVCPICNMRLTAVYRDSRIQGQDKTRKILFYRHPKDSTITSKVPAKDETGAEYIPVYEVIEEDGNYYGCGCEGEEHVFLIKGIKGLSCPICKMPLKKLTKEQTDSLKGVVGRVKIKAEQVRLAGVETQPVSRLQLYKEIRTVGKVAFDPQLAVAEEEFISALNTMDKIQEGKILEIKERAKNLFESSKRKLRLLGLSEEQIKDLESKREVHTNLILPEERMWIYADVYEYELGWVKVGQKIKVTTSSLPGEEFKGTISSVNPVLDPRTRSIKFRAEVGNPGLKLKPEMYVDVVIMSMYMNPEGEHMVLAIPKNAVLDTGTRRIVWIDKGNGEFEGRTVEIGPEATSIIESIKIKFYPILKGLDEGEIVVTKANFLIDSQSQITGVSASAYSGAMGAEEKKAAPVHQH